MEKREMTFPVLFLVKTLATSQRSKVQANESLHIAPFKGKGSLRSEESFFCLKNKS